jgi:hypothetical protein
MWIYPLETLGSGAMRDHIREWASPDFHDPAFWPFLALLALAVISLVGSDRPLGTTQALMLLGTGVAGLQSMRHIPLFAIIAIAFVAPHLDDVVQRTRGAGSHLRDSLGGSRPIAALTATLSIVVAALYVSAAIGNNNRAVAEIYPADMVDVIVESDLVDSRGFNTYGWGGYMIWRELPVFIDGRGDVYGDEFMERYFAAKETGDGWRELFDEYGVDYALLDRGAELNAVLAEADDWVRVLDDEVAELFVRCAPDLDCGDAGVVARQLGLPES